jgi:hypothetical protein
MYASVIELQYIIVLGKFSFRLFRASINHVIAISISFETFEILVLFYMIPTPHNVLDLVQEISRAGEMARTLLPWFCTTHIIYAQVSLKESCCDFYRLP